MARRPMWTGPWKLTNGRWIRPRAIVTPMTTSDINTGSIRMAIYNSVGLMVSDLYVDGPTVG